MKKMLIYTAFWFGMVAIAILNGVIREKIYGRYLEELPAHQVSTFIGLFLFGAYIWILSKKFPIGSSTQALTIGGIWLVMTVIFEFVFGHFVMGQTWSRLFYDYNLLKGRMWSLVLVWTAIAPYLFYRIRS